MDFSLTIPAPARHWILVLEALFMAVLFLQSGLDKCLNWKSNLEFHQSHFKDSPLSGVAPMLLLVLTCMELTTGLLSVAATWLLHTTPGSRLIPWAYESAALVFLGLFAGQRLARDYAGAAALVPYFILALFGILLAA